MAEFSPTSSCFKPFSDVTDPSMELFRHLPELGGSAVDFGVVGYADPTSYLPEFSLPFHDLGVLRSESSMPTNVAGQNPVSSAGEQRERDKKRKAAETPGSGSQNCSEVFSETGSPEAKASKKNRSAVGKKKSNSKDETKPKVVVHVRARRGQATDSHSLAERVRREKINEKMRCLQSLVPGCSKTMGMAGMLDEIINYVQSLQNQVEFLSMKLSAASSFYYYNLDMDTVAAAEAPVQQVGSGLYYIDEAPGRSRAMDTVEEEMAASAAAQAQEQEQASSAPRCPVDPTFGPWLHPCL